MKIIESVRVIVASQTALFTEAICKILENEKDIKIIAQAFDPSGTVRFCEKTKPNVLLLDIDMPGLYVKKNLALIKERSPQTGVILFVKDYTEEEEMVITPMLDNVKGYITKAQSASQLIEAIRSISKGKLWRGKIEDATRRQKLTKREREIAELVAKGYSNKKVAQKLYISERTIKAHLTAIFNKLGIGSRYELMLYKKDNKTSSSQ